LQGDGTPELRVENVWESRC